MTELDDFRSQFLPRLIEAERALHQVDVGPRLELWTRNEPVTLFGAIGAANIGWDEIGPMFDWLPSMFSNYQSWGMEVIAADVSGDLAYTVAIERQVTSINDGPVQPYALRVTQIYRRENGEWKVVHRHGDALADQSAVPRISG